MKKITLLLLLLATNAALAQSWHSLGAPSSEAVANTALAVDGDDNIYQAYVDLNDYQISVRRYDGTGWEQLPSPGTGSTSPFGISLKVNSAGTPYAAFLDGNNSNRVLVMEYNGTAWDTLGSGPLSMGTSQTVRMAMASDDTPLVAFAETDSEGMLKVMAFNGTDWEMIGSTDPSLNGSIVTDLKVNSEDMPYVSSAKVGSGFVPSVIRFNGTAWEDVGALASFGDPILPFSMAFNSEDDLYIAGANITSSMPMVLRFNGTNWENVVVEGLTPGGANSIEIAFDHEDSLYAVKVAPDSNYRVEVKKFGGVLWENVGSPVFNGPSQGWASLAFDSTNRTYVSYQNGQIKAVVASICPTCPLPVTSIDAMYCDTTVSGFNQIITATAVPGAQQYRFRISDGTTTEEITRIYNQFSIAMLSSYAYNTTYTVDVAVKTPDGWGGYGTACSISIPAPSTTSLSSAYCGMTVSEFSSNTYADAVPLATSYRFKVTNAGGSQVVVRNNNLFRINYLPFYDYSTTYDVEVAAMVDGVWGDYGTVCQLTTPGAATTMLKDEFCGAAVGRKTNIVAQAVPLATQYRFRVSDGAAFTQELVRPNNFFRLNQLSAYTFNTTYTVEVAAKIDGVWQAYGTACTVSYTTAGRMNMSDELDIETNISAYPNPFESAFSVSIETESSEPVHILAYDITGKQLEDITVSPENIGNVTIGDRFAAGIYTVIATQGEYNKTFKVVKK